MSFDLAQARDALARTPSVLRTLVAGLPPEWLAATPAAGEWSAHQVACHLAYVEETDWMVRARMTEIPFMLHYHQKRSASKVVTSITTLDYLVLMAKYATWWGDEGRRWREASEARARRMAGMTLPPVSLQ